MKLLTLFLTNLFAFVLANRVRQVVTVTLVGTVAFTIVAPPAKGRPTRRPGRHRSRRQRRWWPQSLTSSGRCSAPFGERLARSTGAQSVPPPMGAGRLPTSVEQSGASTRYFTDRPVPRSPHRADAGECVERSTAEPGFARSYHAQSRDRRLRPTDQRLRSNLPRDSPTGNAPVRSEPCGHRRCDGPGQSQDAQGLGRRCGPDDVGCECDGRGSKNIAPGEAPFLAAAGITASVRAQATVRH